MHWALEGLVLDRLPGDLVRVLSRATHQRSCSNDCQTAWLAEMERKRKQLARCFFLSDQSAGSPQFSTSFRLSTRSRSRGERSGHPQAPPRGEFGLQVSPLTLPRLLTHFSQCLLAGPSLRKTGACPPALHHGLNPALTCFDPSTAYSHLH